jgi:hypothetical protein
MKVEDLLEMPDDTQVTQPVEVQIVSVGDVIKRSSGDRSFTLLPLTVQDETGQIKVSWFDPAETDWKVLKPKSGPLTAIIQAEHGSRGWAGAKMGTYNDSRQVTCNGGGFVVPALNGGPSEWAGGPKAPPSDQSTGQKSGGGFNQPLSEHDLFEFQKRLWRHLEVLASESLGLSENDAALPPDALQPMFAALNTATMQLARNRTISIPETGDPAAMSQKPSEPSSKDDYDDDLPF